VTSNSPVSLPEFFKSANLMQKEHLKVLSQHIKAGLTPRATEPASFARIQSADSFLSHPAARPPVPPPARNLRGLQEPHNIVDITPLLPQKIATEELV
jgi:hypothetical protein